MQERRRNETPQSQSPKGDKAKVPEEHWGDLEQRDVKELCEYGMASAFPPDGLILPFLERDLFVDMTSRCLKTLKNGAWERVEYPLLELLVLVYLLKVGPNLPSNDMVSAKELKSAHFFQGPHELRISPLLDVFGQDLSGFKKAAESLGGQSLDLADVAFRIITFPKVPLYYLFWEGDDEFEPRLSVLFDRTIEKHLSADAIWGLVNLMTDALLRAPDLPF